MSSPTNSMVTIPNADPNKAITAVEDLDLRGRQSLYQSGDQLHEMDISALTSGIYLIRVHTQAGQTVKRVVRN